EDDAHAAAPQHPQYLVAGQNRPALAIWTGRVTEASRQLGLELGEAPQVFLRGRAALPHAAQVVLGDDQLQDGGAVLGQEGELLEVVLDRGRLALAQAHVQVNVDQLDKQPGVVGGGRQIGGDVRAGRSAPVRLEAADDRLVFRRNLAGEA